MYIIPTLSLLLNFFWHQVTKKPKKYDDDEDFEESEDAESDITESDFEDPDEMEVCIDYSPWNKLTVFVVFE